MGNNKEKLKIQREGQIRVNKKNEIARCIEYIDAKHIIIKFEFSGEIKNTSWSDFNKGNFIKGERKHIYVCGIYKITNKIKNISYIGQSVDIYYRWEAHKKEAYKKESPLYNSYLYRSMRRYGINNFSFEIIEECPSELLNEKEIYWIKHFNTYRNGYNNTLGGDHGYKVNREELLNYYNNITHDIDNICDYFKIKKKTVFKILRENNIICDRYVSKEEEMKICQYYVKNNCPSLNEMYNIFQRSKDVISAILKKHNIEIIYGDDSKILVYNSLGKYLYTTTYKIFNKKLKDDGIIKNKSGSIADVLHGRRKQAYGYIIRYYIDSFPLEIKVDKNWKDDYWNKERIRNE